MKKIDMLSSEKDVCPNEERTLSEILGLQTTVV